MITNGAYLIAYARLMLAYKAVDSAADSLRKKGDKCIVKRTSCVGFYPDDKNVEIVSSDIVIDNDFPVLT